MMPAGDRAPRFTMMLSMRYRRAPSESWTPAKTVNISRSGVLFEADTALGTGTAVEVLVELSEQDANLAALRCSAAVVRQDGAQRTAARFVDYHLMSRKAAGID